MRVALLQLRSTTDVDANLERTESLIRQAASQGAHWILTPENTPFLGADRDKLAVAEPLDGPTIRRFCELAATLEIWLTIGSMAECSPDPERTYNTQVLISPNGRLSSIYRKIHLFDVDVDDDTSFCESTSVYPGDKPTIATIDDAQDQRWSIGQSICYDLRFPELYRHYQGQRCQILTVPSAFTRRTGSAHWHALLRARAVENQAYVLAPNQWGHHFGKRYSYGQSAIYDPWGQRVACASDGERVIMADLDAGYVDEIRRAMPVLDHRRVAGASVDGGSAR